MLNKNCFIQEKFLLHGVFFKKEAIFIFCRKRTLLVENSNTSLTCVFWHILAKKVTTCHHQLRKNKTKEFKGPKNRNVSYAIFSILLLNEKNSSVIGKGDCFSSYFIADKINLRMRQGDIIHQTIRKRYKKKFSFKCWWTLFSSANFNIRVRKKV